MDGTVTSLQPQEIRCETVDTSRLTSVKHQKNVAPNSPHHQTLNVVTALHETKDKISDWQKGSNTVRQSIRQTDRFELTWYSWMLRTGLWPAVSLSVVCCHLLHKPFQPKQKAKISEHTNVRFLKNTVPKLTSDLRHWNPAPPLELAPPVYLQRIKASYNPTHQ